LTTKKCCKKF